MLKHFTLLAVALSLGSCSSPASDCAAFVDVIEQKANDCVAAHDSSREGFSLRVGATIYVVDDSDQVITIALSQVPNFSTGVAEEQLVGVGSVACIDAARFSTTDQCSASIIDADCSDLLVCSDPFGGPDGPCSADSAADGTANIVSFNLSQRCGDIEIE